MRGLGEKDVFGYDSIFERLRIGDLISHRQYDKSKEYIEKDLSLLPYSIHSLTEKAIFYFQLHNYESDDYELSLHELCPLLQLNRI